MKKYLRDGLVSLFWRLPYETRRSLFKVLQPSEFETYQSLRRLDADNEDSLLPFDTHKCIFVHIPKCAGLSIGSSLFGHTPGSHMSVLTFQLIYSKEEYERYFKFTFTRNPWDRLVSAFKFLKGGGLTDEDRRWAETHLRRYDDFESFVKGWVTPRNVLSWQHFKPQTRFIYNPQGELQVDYVGRFERLTEDFAHIARQLGIQAELVHVNKSRRKKKRDYRSYYNEETKRIVGDVYRESIDVLGYDFNGLR